MPNSSGFVFFPTDFMGDDKVRAMSCVEIGAHIQLMCIAWQQTPVGTLPDDDKQLAKWCQLSLEEWLHIRVSVTAAYKKKRGRWYQEGLRQAHQKQQRISGQRRDAVNARWSKEKDTNELQMNNKSNTPNGKGLSTCSSTKRSRSKTFNYTDDFLEFWVIYPHTASKKKAFERYLRCIADGDDPKLILQAARNYAIERKDQDPQYTLHAKTWLNQTDFSEAAELLPTTVGEPPIPGMIYDKEKDAWVHPQSK